MSTAEDLAAFNADPQAPAQSVTYTYDAFGRSTTVTDSLNGTTATTYNADGQTIRIASPEGIVNHDYDPSTSQLMRTWTGTDAAAPTTATEYTYDSLGRLKTVTQTHRDVTDIADETTQYVYDVLGNLDETWQGNGVVSDYTYDDMNRLDLLTHYAPEDGTDDANDFHDNTIIASYDYTLREDGFRTGTVETSADGVTIIGWTYDNLGRLTSETYDSYDDSLDYATTYIMDLVGNRLEKLTDVDGDADMDEVVTYTYDANDRLLTESLDSDGDGVVDQTTAYTYGPTEQTAKTVTDEATGDIVEQTTYEYNVQGRLAKVTTVKDGQTTVTEFAYNDQGIRVSKTVDGQATDYVIDANNHTGYAQVLEEHDAATGDVTKSFTIGHDVHVQWDETNGTVTLITDGHGSTRFTVDAAAGVVQRYDYDAYGNLLNSAFTPITDLLYSGEFFDATTGLQYLRARYYNPNTGRFNRLDPFVGRKRDPQSLHKYLYCHAMPTMGIDPSGNLVALAGWQIALGILATLLVCSAIWGPDYFGSDLGYIEYRCLSSTYYEANNRPGAARKCEFEVHKETAEKLVTIWKKRNEERAPYYVMWYDCRHYAAEVVNQAFSMEHTYRMSSWGDGIMPMNTEKCEIFIEISPVGYPHEVVHLMLGENTYHITHLYPDPA
jgi:RHS repeat-associated protein